MSQAITATELTPQISQEGTISASALGSGRTNPYGHDVTDDQEGQTGLYGQDSGSYLGLSVAGQEALSDVDAAYLNHFAADELSVLQAHLADLESLKRLFIDHRHGCWCGPGHLCEDEQDAMDGCCHAHDQAYDAVSVTSGGPGSGGGIDMWSRQGLQATVEADEALIACVSGLTDLDNEAAAYRAGVELIFGNRARIGRLLRRLPF